MTWDEPKLRKIALLTVPVVGLFACLFLGALTFFALQARESLIAVETGSSGLVTKVNAALDTINAPCTDNGHQYVCGTLANVNQATKNIGIVAAQGAEQVKQSGDLIKATTANINSAGDSVKSVASNLGDTAKAATGALNATKDVVSAAKPVLDNAATLVANIDTEQKPLIGRATLFMDDADTFTKTLPPLSANLTTLTGNLDATTGDFQTKFHAFLFPAPCHQFKCHLGEIYNGAVDASKFIEPALYLKELLFGNTINGAVAITH